VHLTIIYEQILGAVNLEVKYLHGIGHLFIILVVATLMPSCTNGLSQGTGSDAHQLLAINSMRLMIKFAEPSTRSAVIKKLQTISEETAIKLVYVREMSGGAYVIKAQHHLSSSQFIRQMDKIRGRDDIEYIEVDRLLYHQDYEPNMLQKGLDNEQ